MGNLITYFQNPEFAMLFRLHMLDAIVTCTTALCSYFIIICLQGKHNTITWKRIGLIYIYMGMELLVLLVGGMIEVYFEGTVNFVVTIVEYIAILYHPILIALFYKKKRFRIAVKVFILYILLQCACAFLIFAFRMIIQVSGKQMIEQGFSEYMAYLLQTFSDDVVACYVGVMILCAILIVLMYFGLYKNDVYLKIRFIYLLLIGLWPWVVLGIASIFTLQTESDFLTSIRYCFIGLILIVSMLLPILFVLSGVRRQLKEKNKAQELYLESELAYIEQYKKSQEKTRAFRHDIKNNLSLLQYMAKDGKMEEVLNFLEELSGKMKEMSPQYITGDEMLDCIVAMKADKMSEMDIGFKMDGVLDGGLHIKPLEICTIFANVLDNAIEAAGKVEEADKRWISMTLKKSGQFWVINVENSTDGQTDIDKIQSGGYTSKEDKGHHGFGLFNIRQAVEKLDGVLKLDAKEDAFSLTVMLPKAG